MSYDEEQIKKFTQKKRIINKISDKYLELNKIEENKRFSKTALNMFFCYSKFHLEVYQQINNTDNKKSKTMTEISCKNRFCPTCNHVKSKKHYTRTYQAIEKMRKDGIDFIGYHLTLTIKNPEIQNLENDYILMNKAFDNFMKNYKELKEFLVGYQASKEVEQSKEAKIRKEFHPHIHVLLLLKPSFYNSVSRNQKITSNDIFEKWIKCCEFYGLVAGKQAQHLQKIKVNKDKIDLNDTLDPFLSAISEVSKYGVKPSTLDKISVDDFYVLETSLYKKRQLSFGGLLKKYITDEKSENEFLHENEFILSDIYFLEFMQKKYNVDILNEIEKTKYVSKKETEEMIRKNMKEFKKSDEYKHRKEIEELRKLININYELD
jgi:hypothetical protein